ncbi:hypothetical protein KS4_01610 [Poriferisphaera corsica]|uniref:Uncharacterized protein n=1 Tax=Poriferisphaera corsica TaxID=2528020 RepID=A0A517YPJ8_9BACT|nr:hypothetical protein KS4_01610 [Poriferisphaera corsica]
MERPEETYGMIRRAMVGEVVTAGEAEEELRRD